MIDFDNLRDKAEEFVEEHATQIDSGIDKAAEFAGKKYGHDDQIDKGAAKLKEFLPGGDAEEQARGRQAHGGGGQGPRGGQGQHRGGQGGRGGPGRRGGPNRRGGG